MSQEQRFGSPGDELDARDAPRRARDTPPIAASLGLLPEDQLPEGIAYPGCLLRLIARGVVYLEPWFILQGDMLHEAIQRVRTRFPHRTLLPFAQREDTGTFACLDRDYPGRVIVIHERAQSPRGETTAPADILDSVADWIRCAVEDMLDVDAYEDA